LAFASPEFNVAPPHFSDKDVASIPFDKFVAHYDSYSATFRSVIPFLLASIVFHCKSGQLRAILPKEHPLWSSTLFIRHWRLLNALEEKVLGGKVGAQTTLVLTGNSVSGDTRTDVAEIRTQVEEIRSTVTSMAAHIGIVERRPMSTCRMEQQLEDIHKELRCVRQRIHCEADVVAAAGTQVVMPRRCVPVFYLSNSFKLFSCQPFTLLIRWVTPEPPAPAWRYIRNEMLPRTDGRRSQENLLSVYNHFMQAFMGSNPNISDIEANIDFFFQAAWSRMVRVCEWDSGRCPTCTTKTVYNWLLEKPEKLKLLKNSKVVTSVSFAAEAAASARQARDTQAVSQPEFTEDIQLQATHASLPSIQVVQMLPPATCVPRNALLYPVGAPVPPPPLRKGATRRVQDDTFDAYLEQNAPKPGARPCWPCPFCLTSRHFHKHSNLMRHIRSCHDDKPEEEKDLVLAQGDIARLVWCTNRTCASHWEPILT
jgi:hypothetical protein